MSTLKTYQVPNNGTEMNIIYYAQGKEAGGGSWATLPFGGGTIATSGCSIASIGMVFSYLNNALLTPDVIRQKIIDVWGDYNHFYVAPDGASWDIFPQLAKQYDIICTRLFNIADIQGELQAGKPVIQSCNYGLFTSGKGHIIVLTGQDDEGYYHINNPNGSLADQAFTDFTLNRIISQGKGWWSFTNSLSTHGNYPTTPSPVEDETGNIDDGKETYFQNWIYGNRDLTLSEMQNNATIIYNYFTGKGWSLNAIAGMLGNMQKESTINPGRWEDGTPYSGGYGLVQWTPYTNYSEWAGTEWENNGGRELERIMYEFNGGAIQWIPTTEYPETFAQYSVSTATPEYLAECWLYNYERPEVKPQPSRETYARYWYNYFEDYEPTTPDTPTYPIIPAIPSTPIRDSMSVLEMIKRRR